MRSLRWLVVLTMVLGLVGVVFATAGEAQRGYGMHHGMWGPGPGYDRDGGWSYCPYCGRDLRGRGDYGPGYGDRGGYPMGPGMMGPGYYGHRGRGPGMMGPNDERGYHYREDPRFQRPQEPLKKEEAKEQVQEMLTQSRNPNLKVGDVSEKEGFFEVDILTKGGELVDKMEVDKETGMMRSAY